MSNWGLFNLFILLILFISLTNIISACIEPEQKCLDSKIISTCINGMWINESCDFCCTNNNMCAQSVDDCSVLSNNLQTQNGSENINQSNLSDNSNESNVSCSNSLYPACGGACSDGQFCVSYSDKSCGCIGANAARYSCAGKKPSIFLHFAKGDKEGMPIPLDDDEYLSWAYKAKQDLDSFTGLYTSYDKRWAVCEDDCPEDYMCNATTCECVYTKNDCRKNDSSEQFACIGECENSNYSCQIIDESKGKSMWTAESSIFCKCLCPAELKKDCKEKSGIFDSINCTCKIKSSEKNIKTTPIREQTQKSDEKDVSSEGFTQMLLTTSIVIILIIASLFLVDRTSKKSKRRKKK